jgi:hypothetical protein
MPYESEFIMMRVSPSVVSEENEAFRGSINMTTPIAARAMPIDLIRRSGSVRMMAPISRVKIGIVTARSEVFDALVSERPPMNSI